MADLNHEEKTTTEEKKREKMFVPSAGFESMTLRGVMGSGFRKKNTKKEKTKLCLGRGLNPRPSEGRGRDGPDLTHNHLRLEKKKKKKKEREKKLWPWRGLNPRPSDLITRLKLQSAITPIKLVGIYSKVNKSKSGNLLIIPYHLTEFQVCT